MSDLARPHTTRRILAPTWPGLPALQQISLVGAGLLCGVALLYLAVFRYVNLDEGWYLWAAMLVYKGSMPYRDFAYTQTPLLPYVYGLPAQILGLGVLQGRVITLTFALAAWGLTAAAAQRLGGLWAAIITLLLLGSSWYAASYFVYTATYALTAFWIALALYVAVAPGARSPQRAAVATLIFSLAVATRLSALAALPPLALFLILDSQKRRETTLAVAGSLLLGGALLFAPFWLLAGEQMRYGILGFHTEGALGYAEHLATALTALVTSAIDFAVPLLLALAGVGIAWLRAARRHALPPYVPAATAALLMALALLAVHLLPRTTDSYYNSLQLPLLAFVAGVATAPAAARLRPRSLVFLLLGMAALNGALQTRAIARQGILDFPPQNHMVEMNEAAAFLERYTTPGDRLISFNTHLALEAGLALPAGFEMSIFSYHPTWSDEEAARYSGVNNNRLLALLVDKETAAAALTTFDIDMLYGARQEIMAALYEHYRWATTIPNIGPHLQELYIYLLPQFTAPAPQIAGNARVGDQIAFLGYDLQPRRVQGNDYLQLALYWQAGESPLPSYTVFTQLIDASGRLAVGQDNPPCRHTCPTETWQAGEVIRDEYWLPLGDLAPGRYRLLAGMYIAESGQRLPVVTAGGRRDYLDLGEIRR